MLKINFQPDFIFSLTPINRKIDGQGGPYSDWIQFDAVVKDGDFSGAVQWEAMPEEIENFKRDIIVMYDGIFLSPGKKYRAVLQGEWQELKLVFETSNLVGSISVQYALQHMHGRPALSGWIGVDQSFLPAIVKSLDSILAFPATPMENPY